MAFEEIIFKRAGKRDLKFSGSLVAEKTGGGKKYQLYETEGGNSIAWDACVNEELEETAVRVAQIQLTEPIPAGQIGIFDFFGWNELAKELYAAVGIDPYETVE